MPCDRVSASHSHLCSGRRQKLRCLRQVVIHGFENRCKVLPLQDQSARSDLELAECPEPDTDVPGGHAKRVVQERGKQGKTQAQGCLGSASVIGATTLVPQGEQ